MTQTNFYFLQQEFPILYNVAQSAELHVYTDPVTSLKRSIFNYFPKDEYINRLIDYHDLKYPIIPVMELNSLQEEPRYIFTVEKKGTIYLIWENNFNGRATYVFTANKQNYTRACQSIYDFISAELKEKRMGIKDYAQQISVRGSSLNYKKKIIHNGYDA